MRVLRQIKCYPERIVRLIRRYVVPLTVSAVALTASMMMACEDRGGPTFASSPPAGIDSWTRVHLFVETRFTQFNDLPTTAIRVYTPPGYQGKSLGRPYPVLYMLSPFRGDEFFYLQHGLQVVMDRLIDEGVIEPMIVVSVNASGNTFGGSFYGNYVTNGDYLNLVSHSLAPFIDTQFNTFGNLPLVGSVPNTPQLRADLRAISGYEMGGYGAFRAALTSGDISTGLPSEFGSVSAISAPLNFTDPIYGFQNLFAGAIAEWGSYDAIDTSQTTPISSFLIAAAIGFSPEDTAYKLDPSNPFQVDTVYKILDSSNIDTAIDTFPLETNIVFITIDTVIDTPTIDTTIGSTVLFDSFFDTSFFDTTIDTLVTIDSLFDTTITFDTFVLPGTTIILVDTIVDTTIFPPDTMFDTMIDTPPLDSARVDTILTIFDTLIDTSFLFTIDSMFNPIDTTFDIRTEDTFLTYNPPTDLMFAAVPNPLTQEDNILRIFLPFDSLAQPYDSIWPVWQRNDIANLVDNVDVSVLNSFSDQMLIMATRDAKFAHFQQDSLLFAKLNSMGYTAHFVEYSGYDGFADVDGARYLFEVWPTLLKFHSDRFHEFIPPELQIENYKKGF